jgi:heptosyltransferase-2
LGIAGAPLGISPGAAYGNAKRWFPERFAEAAARFPGVPVVIFGSSAERELCKAVAGPLERAGMQVRNVAGETTLRAFVEMAAACRLFLTNDSGAMHVASALGLPTVAVFGATDDTTTGPTGSLARVVRNDAECSPCLLRECPIDHRCMERVTAEMVYSAACELTAPWTQETRF